MPKPMMPYGNKNLDVKFLSNFLHFNLIVPYWPNFPHSFCCKSNSQPILSSIDEHFQPIHGGPSEAGDCNHPPAKMATAENLTSGKAAFYYIAGYGSLRFSACKQVLNRVTCYAVIFGHYASEWSNRTLAFSCGKQVTSSKAAGA